MQTPILFTRKSLFGRKYYISNVTHHKLIEYEHLKTADDYVWHIRDKTMGQEKH